MCRAPTLFIASLLAVLLLASHAQADGSVLPIRVRTAFGTNESAYLSWYDYGKLLALHAAGQVTQVDASTDGAAADSGCTAGGRCYTVALADRTLLVGDVPDDGTETFIVAPHDVAAALVTRDTSSAAHVFAPTFDAASLTDSQVPTVQKAFTRPSLGTEAAAMLWLMYERAPAARTAAIVLLDTDGPAGAAADEMASELRRHGLQVTRYTPADVIAGVQPPRDTPFDVAFMLGGLCQVDAVPTMPASVIDSSFAATLIVSSAATAAVSRAARSGLGDVAARTVEVVSHMPFTVSSEDVRFNAVNAALLEQQNSQGGPNAYFAVDALTTDLFVQQQFTTAGFMDMLAFLTVVARVDRRESVSVAAFANQLHSLFTFGFKNEWLIGPFTGDCSGAQRSEARITKLGLACNNIYGGHRLVQMSLDVVAQGITSLAYRDASHDFVVPPDMTGVSVKSGSYTPGQHALSLCALDDAPGLAVTDDMMQVLSTAQPGLTVASSTDGTLFIGALNSTSTDASAATIASREDVLFVDPVDPSMTLRHNQPNVLYVSSTVEQELHVLAQHYLTTLDGSAAKQVRLFLPDGAQSGELYDSVKAVLDSYGIDITDSPINFDSIFVCGGFKRMLDDDAGMVGSLHGKSMWVPYDAFALEYEDIRTFLQTNNGNRIYVASSLPRWSSRVGAGAPSSTVTPDATDSLVEAYMSRVPTDKQSPLAMKFFYAMAVLNEIASAVPRTFVEADDVRRAVYKVDGIPHTVRTRNVNLGPYVMALANPNARQRSRRLIKNYGARAIRMWRLSCTSSLDCGPTVAALPDQNRYKQYLEDHYYQIIHPPQPPPVKLQQCSNLDSHPDAPSLTPTTHSPSDSSPGKGKSVIGTAALIGIVVGCACLAAAIVTGLLVYYCCFYMGNTRDNDNAPTDSKLPVTLLFTDIQSSTTLWALAPREMADGLAAHHDIIRRLIVKHKCYEVKTVGDAFMIASRDAHTGVLLAHDIQLALHQHDWGTTQFDDLYRSMAKKNAAGRRADADTAAAAAAGRACWNGLRVRIGVHTGLANIEHDTVTKGYDYYGDTPNTAARTEQLADGGQVLLTQFTVEQLTEEQQQQFDLQSVGPQYMRGVANAIEMYQLNTVGGRVFHTIHTEPSDAQVGHSAASPGAAEDSTAKLSDADVNKPVVAQLEDEASSSADTSPNPEDVQSTRDVLEAFFAPYDLRRRIKLLRNLAKHVGITVLRRPDDSDGAYADELMTALCVHTTKILDIQNAIESAMTDDDGEDSEMSSIVQAHQREASEGDIAIVEAERRTPYGGAATATRECSSRA